MNQSIEFNQLNSINRIQSIEFNHRPPNSAIMRTSGQSTSIATQLHDRHVAVVATTRKGELLLSLENETLVGQSINRVKIVQSIKTTDLTNIPRIYESVRTNSTCPIGDGSDVRRA